MKKPPNKPNAEQIKEFNAYIKHWQNVLHMGDWRIEKSAKMEKDAMASVVCDSMARLATYKIGDFGAAEITPESLSATALHECLHVFLFDLITAASDRAAPPERMDIEEHRVINVLERLLYATQSK
jgi:hypothetical protein